MKRAWTFLKSDLPLWELGLVAWALLASYFATAHGRLDWTGHGLGRDFVNYWSAGHLVREGRVGDIFHPDLFLAHERRLVAPTLPFHFWSYPPPALFLVAPLGLTAYFPGLALWSILGILALIPAVLAWTGSARARWLIVLCPAVATNIALGQNGAFTAALLIGGLALIEARPLWSGVLLGLLIFKPQLALLLPVMVIAAGRWRTMVAAGVTALAVLGASYLVFGAEAWRGFFGPTLKMQTTMLSQGSGPFQLMMPSAFMAGRVLGLPAAWAMAVQGLFSLFAAVLVWRAWRRHTPLVFRASVLMMATFVASPQAFNYDLIPAAAAALLLWRCDSGIGRGLALAVWALPMLMTVWALEGVKQPLVGIIAPVVLTWATVRLVQLAHQSPSWEASASAEGEFAANT